MEVFMGNNFTYSEMMDVNNNVYNSYKTLELMKNVVGDDAVIESKPLESGGHVYTVKLNKAESGALNKIFEKLKAGVLSPINGFSEDVSKIEEGSLVGRITLTADQEKTVARTLPNFYMPPNLEEKTES